MTIKKSISVELGAARERKRVKKEGHYHFTAVLMFRDQEVKF